MTITKTGDWSRARALLEQSPNRLRAATRFAVREEAERLRDEVVRGLTRQAPGGTPLAPPSPLTLAARRLRGQGSTRSLLVTGELRAALQVIVRGDEAFVGISRKARSRSGASLADIAAAQENGTAPIVIPMTPRMRRFLFVLLREAGVAPRGGGSGRGVVVVQIPARPFLKPAFEAMRKGARERVQIRVARLMGWGR